MPTFTNQALLSYNGIIYPSNVVTGEITEALSMTKTALSSDYSACGRIAYAISILNSGSTTLSDLVLTDDLGAYSFSGSTLTPLDVDALSVRHYINGALQPQGTVTVSEGPPLTISNISVPGNGNVLIVYEAVPNQFAPLFSGYGTESVPKVSKIFGPGNPYVTAAKQIVSLKDVAIDMPAGPSEVEVIADADANPAFVAADLLSQAEHGRDSQVILLTTSAELIDKVQAEVDRQVALLPRNEIAEASLGNSRMILLRDDDEIIEMTNEYAPEHLIIQTQNASELAERVINAGSVFIGPWSPESAGDYASGTNHTLPTSGYAKAYSGVNIDSFMRKITFQQLSREGLQQLGPVIETMATGEYLDAHKNAVTVRLKEL